MLPGLIQILDPKMSFQRQATLLIVWDFDYSLINCNSDTFVPESCLPSLRDFIAEGAKTTQWTKLMSQVAMKLYEAGVKRVDIEDSLEKMPIFSEVVSSIQLAHSQNAQQLILSDANTIYISRFLKSKGLGEHFSSIISNPATWTDQGLLQINPYHSHHSCSRCPTNLCKGLVMDTIIHKARSMSSDYRILYIGDGEGDFCPCLRLQKHDVVAARSGYRLAKLLKDADALEASVLNWVDGSTLSQIITSFLKNV